MSCVPSNGWQSPEWVGHQGKVCLSIDVDTLVLGRPAAARAQGLGRALGPVGVDELRSPDEDQVGLSAALGLDGPLPVGDASGRASSEADRRCQFRRGKAYNDFRLTTSDLSVETVTLSSKGQLVLPKPVRDALRLKPGQRLSITVENRRIVIELDEPSVPQWQPLNPAGVTLSATELSRPVDLKRDTGRR